MKCQCLKHEISISKAWNRYTHDEIIVKAIDINCLCFITMLFIVKSSAWEITIHNSNYSLQANKDNNENDYFLSLSCFPRSTEQHINLQKWSVISDKDKYEW